ncbi:MAG: hypothetical protein LBH45_06785, partial [Campylobacteraceae bacterium]|nr:hypothetical protein [Campylobacteraceae bacterium]
INIENKGYQANNAQALKPEPASYVQNAPDTPSADIIPQNKNDIKPITQNGYEKIIDHIFNKAEKGVKSLDEVLSNAVNKIGRVAGQDWQVKHIFTVEQIVKDISEMTNDFKIAKGQINEMYSNIKINYLDKLDKQQMRSLIQALNGDLDPAKLPANLKGTYDSFRSLIDSNADMLVKLGALSEKSKIKDYLKRYYEQYLEEVGEFKAGIRLERVYKRKNLTHDERIALGMIEDEGFVVMNTLKEQRTQIMKAKFLADLANKYGSDTKADGLIRISDETVGGGVRKYGALAGKYVPKEVADAVHGAGIYKVILFSIFFLFNATHAKATSKFLFYFVRMNVFISKCN